MVLIGCSEYKTKTTQHIETMTSVTDNKESSIQSPSIWWSHTKGAKMSDGSFYEGFLDRFGRRSGAGVWRSPMTIFGVYDPQNIKSMFHWTEYEGVWKNDLPNGYGVLRSCCGDGTKEIVYEGEWVNGNQQEQ
jgi:hypothetical protein